MAGGGERGENAGVRIATRVPLALVALVALALLGCSDDEGRQGGSGPSDPGKGCPMPGLEVEAPGRDPASSGEPPNAPGMAPVAAVGGPLRVTGKGFHSSCGSTEPFDGLLSVELVQGDRRVLVAEVSVRGEDGSFEVTTAVPPTAQVGPAEVDVMPAAGEARRSAHAVAQFVVEVPGG